MDSISMQKEENFIGKSIISYAFSHYVGYRED
jgi:hypothetical protein